MTLEKKTKTKSNRNGPDISDLQNFLSKFEVKPTVHVNGAQYLNCVLTVDFGEPIHPVSKCLSPPKISDEEEETLKEKMKAASKAILNKDLPVRISKDGIANVWWASVG